jgi:hypothetical protein
VPRRAWLGASAVAALLIFLAQAAFSKSNDFDSALHIINLLGFSMVIYLCFMWLDFEMSNEERRYFGSWLRSGNDSSLYYGRWQVWFARLVDRLFAVKARPVGLIGTIFLPSLTRTFLASAACGAISLWIWFLSLPDNVRIEPDFDKRLFFGVGFIVRENGREVAYYGLGFIVTLVVFANFIIDFISFVTCRIVIQRMANSIEFASVIGWMVINFISAIFVCMIGLTAATLIGWSLDWLQHGAEHFSRGFLVAADNAFFSVLYALTQVSSAWSPWKIPVVTSLMPTIGLWLFWASGMVMIGLHQLMQGRYFGLGDIVERRLERRPALAIGSALTVITFATLVLWQV